MKLLFSVMSLASAFFAGLAILYPWSETVFNYRIRRIEKHRQAEIDKSKSINGKAIKLFTAMHNLDRNTYGLSGVSLTNADGVLDERLIHRSYDERKNTISNHYHSHEAKDLRPFTVVLLLAMLIFGIFALLMPETAKPSATYLATKIKPDLP